MPKPYPAITPETEFFWTAGLDGKLRFQRCDACRTYVHPPQPRCPECLCDGLSVTTVSGRGTVSTYTVNQHQWHPEFPPPYVIAIVEIDEARYVRLTSRLIGCDPSEVTFGMPVQVLFEQQGPAYLPLFAPVRP